MIKQINIGMWWSHNSSPALLILYPMFFFYFPVLQVAALMYCLPGEAVQLKKSPGLVGA